MDLSGCSKIGKDVALFCCEMLKAGLYGDVFGKMMVMFCDIFRSPCHLESRSPKERRSLRWWNHSSFDPFREKGYRVHLDGEELEDLAHMAKADVLLAAPSGFSLLAGFFNSKCG